MTIRFNCPTCGVELEVPDDAAGRSGKCSECDGPIVVPTPVTPPDSGPERAGASPGPTPPAQQPPPAEPAPPTPPEGGATPVADDRPAELVDLEKDEPLSEADFGPAAEEPPPDEFSRVLDVGESLQPEKDWSQTRIFRVVSVLVVLIGLAWIGMNGRVYGYAGELARVQQFTPREFSEQALEGLGLAGAVNELLIGLGGLLMVICGLLGLAMRDTARKGMMCGLGLVAVSEGAYAGVQLGGLFAGYVEPQPHTVAMAAAAVLLALPLLFFLSRADRILEQARADEFANIIPLVNRILRTAHESRASDVHIEPTTRGCVVRFRIDGILHTAVTYPQRALDRIISRIKVMASMDIAEKRTPQDGGCSFNMGGRSVDLRVSTVPSHLGERAVIRILDQDSSLFTLKRLGMGPTLLDRMHRLVQQPHGMFFCTGPTGSGKTTTLYAALLHINRGERNVITVEDPVEYHLPGIAQLPVNKRKGMTFADGMRSILRQDPDVIMVGEVRDHDTAAMAAEAAQTGHLVLSTLHTNDSAGAISRLLDLRIEPYRIGSALTAVLAQRLVRRVCPDCRRRQEPTAGELRSLGLAPGGNLGEVVRGTGCPTCMNTGYRGRIGIYELLVVDDTIRELIGQRADAGRIRKAALKAGMVSLRRDGIRKIKAGITTIEEVRRVTQDISLS
jgi:type II secretory ATPase GspE/PulE/Tfp pilus assembly ATPase PilB-like protein